MKLGIIASLVILGLLIFIPACTPTNHEFRLIDEGVVTKISTDIQYSYSALATKETGGCITLQFDGVREHTFCYCINDTTFDHPGIISTGKFYGLYEIYTPNYGKFVGYTLLLGANEDYGIAK